jgi:hypothetical protein
VSVPARKTVLGLFLAAGLVFAVTLAPADPSGGCLVGATTTCTFNYTRAAEAWVVPAGVTSAVSTPTGRRAAISPPSDYTRVAPAARVPTRRRPSR